MRVSFSAVATAAVCNLFVHQVSSQELLNNDDPTSLNTGVPFESVTTKEQRMAMQVPDGEDHDDPVYDPLTDAICFTDNYDVPTDIDHTELYNDFIAIFHYGLAFPTSVSEENNNVSNDRFAAMYLRMCFHDNAVDPSQGDFPTYASNHLQYSSGRWHWDGPSPWLATSGSDASVLTCVAERHHPNQNYDKTATRVLKTMQNSIPGAFPGQSQSQSLKKKYGLSYADLLHNGCIAAASFATGVPAYNDGNGVLDYNPFEFGRKDACHKQVINWGLNTVTIPLCGPTELLPGVLMDVNEVDDWFVSRGMSRRQWLAFFWTHTLMDNTAHKCPVRHLPCTHDPNDSDWSLDKTDYILYDGAVLDYFSYFTTQGEHDLHSEEEAALDLELPNCDWEVNGVQYDWPMTRVDCAIAKDHAIAANRAEVEDALDFFAGMTKEDTLKYLLCSHRMLATMNPSGNAGGACDSLGTTSGHHFGAHH